MSLNLLTRAVVVVDMRLPCCNVAQAVQVTVTAAGLADDVDMVGSNMFMKVLLILMTERSN